jgi:hypothetical protein
MGVVELRQPARRLAQRGAIAATAFGGADDHGGSKYRDIPVIDIGISLYLSKVKSGRELRAWPSDTGSWGGRNKGGYFVVAASVKKVFS